MIELFLINLILWKNDFKSLNVRQLYDYKISIQVSDERLILKGEPEDEGHSAAWLYLPENLKILSCDTLFIKIKVNKNTVRLRYFYLSEDKRVYLLGIKYIESSKDWQEILIPLDSAKPFYSNSFPWSLVPDKKPSMYIFIENDYPGNFDVEIKCIELKGEREGR